MPSFHADNCLCLDGTLRGQVKGNKARNRGFLQLNRISVYLPCLDSCEGEMFTSNSLVTLRDSVILASLRQHVSFLGHS